MKTLRQLCLITTLVFAFAFSANAGEIECPGITQPPPEEITSETQSDNEANITVTEALLTLIEGIFLVV